MSIEDPRLSSIDNTSAADDFDTAVEQHLGFAREAVDGIEVAQAETPEAGRTDRLPSQAPVQTVAAVVPTEVTPNAENVVTLPAGIELDNLEFEVDGENLILILADGTEIVVVGGAANIPTFLIGDVELPQVALFAALEDSNINVAAGPDGTFSAQGAPDASRNFEDDPIDAGPEDFALADLLGDTAFGDELRTGTILGDDGEPTILSPLTESFIYDEAVIADSDTGNQIIEGTLPFERGPDFGTITRINFVGASNVDEGDGSVLPGFTSGGLPITVKSFAAPSDGTIKIFEAIQAVDSEGNVVFTLSVNRETGEFTFELIGQLEHPDAGADGSQDDMDDLLRLAFTYTVTDLDGDSVTGSFNIDVMDDAPTFGGAEEGAVDEDYLWNGNPDKVVEPEPDPETDTDGEQYEVYRAEFIKQEGPSVGGSLGINWGADKGNAIADGGLTETTNDRGVGFTEADVEKLVDQNLTSDGVALIYILSNNGTTLTAYKVSDYGGDKRVLAAFADGGSEEVVIIDEGEGEYYGEPVFSVSLSDDGAGSYEFTLYGNLDHIPTKTDEGSGEGSEEARLLSTETVEEDLSITFHFTAKDSDGDTAGSTFVVKVNDDSPILVDEPLAVTLTVDEDDIDTSTSLGTAPNDGDAQDGSFTGTPGVDNGGPANATSTYGSLQSLVRIGADEKFSFSLVSVADARTYLESLGLTSNGLPLGFDIDASGKITGFVNSQEPGQAVPGQEYNAGPDRLVFEFEVNADGTFKFSLHDQLDHDKLEGNDQSLTIDFGSVLQANDGDGDSVSLEGLVQINVTDDAPVIAPNTKGLSVTVDEDDIDTSTSKGNAPNDGNNPDGSFTGTPGVNNGGPANATSTGSLLSLIKVGADEKVTFSLTSIDDAREYLEGLKLTSNGLPLGFDLSEDGTIIGFVNSQAPGQAVPGQEYNEGADRLVFEFEINEDGTFTFSLSDQLDHAAGNGQNTLTIDFGSALKATDSDGDSVVLEGLVKVNVTDDVPVIAPNAKPISIKVDEDDIDTSTSLGTAPNDGDVQDGSFTGTPGVNTGGPANATSTGNLSSLVKVGADENVSFSLINQADVRAYLESLNLKSNGALIGYDLRTDGTIIAFVNAPGGAIPGQTYDSGDRLVFEFKLNSDGTFKFSLSDQLDHAAGHGQNTLTIDFGSVLQANDKDGDSVKLTGLVKVDVTDDVPVIAPNATPISIKVDEDDIDTSSSLGTSPNDGNVPDGSYTGTPATNTAGPANATSTGNLSSLVKVGADEKVSFSLINQADVRAYLESLNLKSNGALIGYDLRTDGTIIAFVNAPGGAIPGQTYDSGDRLVFEFKLNSDGTFKFSLSDQLDHAAGNGQNTLTIDFGSVLQANDKDGDSVKLTGLVKVDVTDDVPVIAPNATPISIKVDEDDIDTSSSLGTSPNDGNVPDGSYTGTPPTNTAGPANATSTGNLSSLVKVGADENVSFSLINQADMRAYLESLNLKSNGALIGYDLRTDGTIIAFVNAPGGAIPGQTYDSGDRLVFEFKLNSDGTFKFSLSDQLDHTKDDGKSLAIDFGSVLQANDKDGDSVKLSGLVKVNVTDDAPEIVLAQKISRTVDEDDIKTSQSTGTSPADGQGDGSWTGGPGQNGEGGAFIDGSLASVVKGGADDTVKFSFIDETALRQSLSGLNLSSKGEILSFDLQGNVLYGFANVGGPSGVNYDPELGDRPVFKLTLNENGTYTFELLDQLDHDLGAGQNTGLQGSNADAINFGAIIKVTDFDGDSVTLDGAFSVKITDDVPVLSGGKEDRLVDEDDIRTFQSTGNNPNDGDSDGSFTGNPIGNNSGPAFISGSLAGLIKGGADDTVKFSFIDENSARAALENLGLSSKGTELRYDIQGNVLYAYDNDAGSTDYGNGDRLVFKLTLEENGSYTFELADQLDHDYGKGQNTDLQDDFWFKDVEAIDFGSIIKATDNDGDSVSLGGAFSITIRDDVPELSGTTEARIVDEDDIKNLQSTGTSPADMDADGSFTGGPGQGGTGPAFIDGSLADVVKGGADDNVKFSFIDETLARFALSALGLKSQGEALSYQIQGNSLIAYDNNGGPGYGNGDRLVFKLTLSEDGKYTFELADQLDHDRPEAGADENYDLQDGLWFADVTAINFGALIKVTDNDGDSISLNGAFEIKIRDDVPEASIVTDQTVTIDETAGVQNSETTDQAVAAVFAGVSNPGSGLSPIFAKADVIDTTFKTGSDENATTKLALRIDVAASGLQTTAGQDITLYLENGLVVGRVGGPQGPAAFAIAIDADGNVSVAQYTSLKHPDANATDEGIDLTGKISAVFSVKDFDGDVVTKSVSIGNKIVFEDDAPGVSSRSISVAVDEDGLPTGAADTGKATEVAGTGSATVSGVAGALTALFNFGADGAHATQAISLKPTASPVDSGFNSQGGDVLIKVDGNTLTGYVAGTPDRVVFELKVNADGSYDFALKDQIDHPTLDGLAGDDTENLVLSNIDLSGYIVGKDGDGDTVTLDSGKFVVGVQDDIPSVNDGKVAIEVQPPQISEPVPGKVANFVLVLDASGSTDLDEIKDQVEDFLQSVSASGAKDVRVHIVEFSDSAEPVGTYDLIVNGVKNVDALNQAIEDVNDLRSGGDTNYEAGMQQALDWIEGLPAGSISVTTNIAAFDANSGSGYDTARIIGNGTTQIALVSGWNIDGTTVADLINANGNVSDGFGASVGSSDTDIDGGQMLRFDFGAFNDFDGGQAYSNAGNFNGVPVTSAVFKLDDNYDSRRGSDDTQFRYKVVFSDGSVQNGSSVVDNDNTALTITAPAGKTIAYVEFTVGYGYGDVDLQSVTTSGVAPGTLPNADLNKVIFLSDGEPNMTNAGSTRSDSVALDAIENEVKAIETAGNAGALDQKFTIEAFGVGRNPDLSNLGEVEGLGGSASALTNNDTLSEALKSDLDSLAATPGTSTPSVGTFNVASLVKAGADESITFSLKAETSGLPALKSGNTLLTYTVANNVLTAQAGALVVFTLSLAADGKATFTLNAPIDGHGDKAIDFSSLIQAADFDGDAVSLAAGKVVVVVDGVPFGEAQSFETQEDESVSGTVAAIVGDEGGSFALTGNPANGTVVLDPQTGKFTYTPNANWHGTETFTVTVTDDDNDTSNPIVVTVNVASVNDAPETDAKSAAGNEDTTISVTLSGSDVDGTIAGYVIKTLPSNGTLYSDAGLTQAIAAGATVTNATVYFKPAAEYNGSASFTYAAKDNLGLEDSTPATVSITVNPMNDAPDTAAKSAAGNEDTTISVTLSGSDVDGTVAGYVIKTLPSNGTLYSDAGLTQAIASGATVTNATVYFKPAADYNGSASFTYAAKDDLGLEDATPATVSITVNPLNDAPVAVEDQFTTDEDQSIVIKPADLLANDYDVDGDSITVTMVSGWENGTLSIENGNIVFTPAADFSGVAKFAYLITDGHGGSDTGLATINVIAKNDAPDTAAKTASGDEDTTISVTLSGSDVDGTVAGYVIKTLPSNGTLYSDAGLTQAIAAGATVTNATVYFKPAADYSGPASFTYAAKDDLGLEDATPATVSITVNPLNDAPVITSPAAVSVAENIATTTVVYTATATDVDSPTITYSLSGTDASKFEINAGTGAVTFKSSPDYEAPTDNGANNVYNFTVVASDGTASTTKDVAVTVTNVVEVVNQAPVAVDDIIVTNMKNFSVSDAALLMNDTDAEGSPLSIQSAVAISSSDIASHSGTEVSFKDQGNSDGAFNYVVTDGTTPDTASVLVDYQNSSTLNGSAAAEILIGSSNQDTLKGNGGQDQLYGGQSNDILYGDQDDLVLDGGLGNGDTLRVNGGFTSSSNSQISGIETVEMLSAGTLNLSNQSEGFKLEGSSGSDNITGGSGNDIINGGAGADTLTGSAGEDEFRIGGSAGTDTITDFTVNVDTLSFYGNLTGNYATSINGVGSADEAVVIVSQTNLTSGTIASGTSSGNAENTYVVLWNSQLSRAEVWFDTNWKDTGSRSLVAVLSNIDTLTKFQAIDLNDFADHSSLTDPIVLDLDHNGFAFSSIDNGVTFDIDADGKADQIAWTSDDGILAYDVDGDGVIDNGSEIFTPDFNGGKFASGVAALASLDSNGDGKIDADDDAFSKLQVWVDADNDGVSDAGELSSLTDHHVASISLTTDPTGGSEDGQTIFAEGEFTFDDGSTGNFVEVGFDTIFGSDASDALTVIGTDGDDVLHGGMGQVVMTGGAGADTFVFDGAALNDLDVADVITDFNADEGDALDVSALLDSLLGEQATAETAAAAIKATVADGNTTVSVQTGADTWKDVVVLQNHDTAIKVLFDDKHSVTVTHD